MDKIENIQEQDSFMQEIKAYIKKTKNKRMHQRYMATLYHLQGYNNKNISKLLALCEHTVGIYTKKEEVNKAN